MEKPKENGLEILDTEEKEPCLSKTNDDNDLKNTSKDVEKNPSRVSRLAKATSLTKRGFTILTVTVILLLVLLLAIVVMAALWPSDADDNLSKRCSDPACFAASSQLLRNLNISHDPCQDFWEYSCGGWLQKNSIPMSKGRWDVYEEIKQNTREQVRSEINTLPYPTESASVTWKVRNFYESCTALEYIEGDMDKPLKDLIRSLGGWQILREFGRFDPYNWELSRTLRQLHADFSVSAFFKVQVVPDDRNQGKNIIRISPDGLGLPDSSLYYRNPGGEAALAYKSYLKDVVQMMGAVSSDASKFSEDIYFFEKRIAEITPPREQALNYFNVSNKMAVRDINNLGPAIPWRDLLLAIYPHSGLNEDTFVLVDSPKYIFGLSMIISSSDRAALNNYLLWRLVDTYIPYVSKAYTNVHEMFQRQLNGALDSAPRWEQCISTTQKYMGYATGAMMVKETSVRHENAKIIEDMFENIRNTLGQGIADSPWFMTEIKASAMNKVHTMTIQVGLPNAFIQDDNLKEYYSSLTIQRSDYFKNILYGVKFLREIEQKLLLNQSMETIWMKHLLGFQIEYLPTENKVIVPEHLIQRPLFDPLYQLPLLYGSFGTLLSKAIIQSLDDKNILFDSSGVVFTPLDIRVNQSRNVLEYEKKCLVGSYRENNLETDAFLNKTATDSALQVIAVHSAFKALSNILTADNDVVQPGMEQISRESLFFLSYGQSVCSRETVQTKDLDHTIRFQLDNNQRLRGTISQVEGFSEVFDCSSSSPSTSYKICPKVIEIK